MTGGVASGKSAVAERFAARGVPVHDADLVAREVVAPGQPALAAIRSEFGDDVFDAQGALDRRRMREIVFADPGARSRLEAILHPAIRAELQLRGRAPNAVPYALLVIPLLAEAIADYAWVDRILLVDVPEAVQFARLVERDGATPELARRMIAAQAARSARLALADDIIDNTGAIGTLDAAVARLHRRYLDLARRYTSP